MLGDLKVVDAAAVQFLAMFISECGGMLHHLNRTEQDSRGATDGAALQRAITDTREKEAWAVRQLLRFRSASTTMQETQL